MGRPKAYVVRAPGINCDEETVHAWRLAGADAERVHLSRLIERPDRFAECDILTLPGGFSFGDDISAGRIFANRMMQHLADEMRALLDRGRLILGICNGFQILVKAGILTANDGQDRCSLTLNTSGRFACRWVSVAAASDDCAFLEKGREYLLPIAHAEGRFTVAEETTLDPRRIALRYTEALPRVGPPNPNGSLADVAALTDNTGRVLGMMPHPERFVDPTHHPFWTARSALPQPDGLAIFRAAVGHLR